MRRVHRPSVARTIISTLTLDSMNSNTMVCAQILIGPGYADLQPVLEFKLRRIYFPRRCRPDKDRLIMVVHFDLNTTGYHTNSGIYLDIYTIIIGLKDLLHVLDNGGSKAELPPTVCRSVT